MSSTFEKLSSNQVKIQFAVEPEVFEKGVAAAYHKIKGRMNVPGFRRGHAPRKVIEQRFGESVFYDEAFDAIFPDLYKQAVDAHKLDPVDRPSVEIDEIGVGKELRFSATVYVRPDVELGEYKGLAVDRQVVDVTDDDVEAELTRARERVARYIDVTDRPIALDDQADIDYEGFVDGEQFEGGTAQGHKLVIGSGQFIPGFEDGLIGASVGEERDVHVTFPEEYHAEALAGKPAVFKVKVNAIQVKELPALDDEFAKDVSDCDTLEAYRAEIRGRLTKEAEDKADAAFENEIIEEAVENAKVDIPEAMIEDQLTNMMRDMNMRMVMQGLNMKDYLKYVGRTEDELRDERREEAEERVKTQLVLEAIRKAEGIEATDEETEQEMQRYADRGKRSLEEFKQTLAEGDAEYFKNIASTRKTIELLKNSAKAE
ncbi:MAG: trigger factor [Christensenellaceae bacterium]|nr:trigger factor [Christensenellaceae bacterium]MEA5065444.1 trigger factor [Eubacteriales bacterium]MEA5067853.1 trigger factor [Christensenellaceae bacterium]